jgi:hypothetical protein
MANAHAQPRIQWARLQWLWPLCLFVVCFSFALHFGQRARLTKILERRVDLEVLYAPSPQVLEMSSLGFRTLGADLLWIRCLQFFTGVEGRKRPPEQAKPYIDGLLALDPFFKEAYRWAGAALLMSSRGATAQDVELANSYLKRAMDLYPTEYQWPYGIGLNYAFWTPVSDTAARAKNKRVGVEFLERAAQLDGAPPHISTLIAALLFDERNPAEMVRFIKQAYLLENDPEVRNMLAAWLQKVGDDGALLDVRRGERERGRWQASEYPYLEQGLFLLIGSRHVWDLGQGLAARSDARMLSRD